MSRRTTTSRTGVRPKSLAEWRQIVDSYYAARDTDGLVRSPNWAVTAPRFNTDGEWCGDDVIDIVPALPNEVPAPRAGGRALQTEPTDRKALAARTGYRARDYQFDLDLTGRYTAAFIRSTREPRPRSRGKSVTGATA